ncbi:MAG: signal peptidase II [Clostridium sp.]|mgnify:CR=1 FL=1|nr:signal peptidase II [Clostridium sp.]
MIWIIIISVIIALDQIVKFVVIENIKLGGSITIIKGFLYFTHWRNTGAAWGIMQDGKYILIPVSIILIVVMLIFMIRNNDRLLRVAMSMIIGGALGNLIDRVLRSGGVVDFLDFRFWGYHFPTFNVADSFIVIGTMILIFCVMFTHKSEKPLQEGDNESCKN